MTPGEQKRLEDVGVRSIDSFCSSPRCGAIGFVPVVILRDPFEVLCTQVRSAHEFNMKLKEAAVSVNPWSNCPVEIAAFVKNCKGESVQSWRYIASLWKALGIPYPYP